jgi:glycosyltransferase involved in cell wall biosynthesis
VSVILCNFNYGDFIGQAIESVLRQTYINFELIIVDDGSIDNSRYVINGYNDERVIKVFQPNCGQASAFNSGFELCKGVFVAFLDSDDYWTSDKLQKSINAFSPGVAMVQHNLAVVDSKSKKTGAEHPGITPGVRNVLSAYCTENHSGFFSATSGIVARREYLLEIFPLPISWKICADVAITRPLPIWGDVFTLSDLLGYYRIHGANNWMNSTAQRKRIKNMCKYNQYTNEWLLKYGLPPIKMTRFRFFQIIFNKFKSLFTSMKNKCK